MGKAEDSARLGEIVAELRGLSDELGQLDNEQAALIKRDLDKGLRAAPEAPPKQQQQQQG